MTIDIRSPEPVDVDKPAPEDERFHSVTTIIGCLDKPALLHWAAEQTAEAACTIARTLADRIEEDGREAVVKWLRDARFRRPKGERSAAELGTACHAAFEEYALTGVRPEVDEEVHPYLDQFERWCQKWQPEYMAAEVTVYNRTYGFAGTADNFLKVQGVPLIGDYKTSKKSTDARGNPTGPYPEVALQLAAYRHAEIAATWRARRFERFRRRYYALNADEAAMAAPVPEVDGGLVIHVTREHCTAYPVRCDAEVFESFLFILEAFRWSSDVAKTVIGSPLVHESEV